ncbi:MAG: hypothetical protein ACAH88_14705 [Roseimicrobium sp.]
MAKHHEVLADRLRNVPAVVTSPLMATGGSVATLAGPRFDADFPKATISTTAKDWAEGRNRSRWFPDASEKVVIAANTALTTAMTTGPVEMRAMNTAKALDAQLTGPVTVTHASPNQARLQQSMLVLESVIATTRASGNANDALLVVSTLSSAAQRQLLMADQLTGNRLYNQLHGAQAAYAAGQVGKALEARDKPDLERVFQTVRMESQISASLVRMNRRDPSGTEARLTSNFLDHLQKSGVSWEAQQAFADKLAFKTQVAGVQGNGADLAPLGSLKDIGGDFRGDVEGRFTGQLYATLAEAPGVSEQDLAMSLNLPRADLLRVTANASMRGREGDQRVVQTVTDAVKLDVGAGTEGLKPLQGVLQHVSGGRYSPSEFAKLASEGRTVDVIGATLKSSADALAADRATKNAATMSSVLTKMAQKRDYLKDHVINTLGGDAKVKAQNMHDELDAFVKRFPVDQFTKGKLEPVFKQFGTNMTGAVDPFVESGTEPKSNTVNPAAFRSFMAFTQQVSGHQKALADPRLYGEGMDKTMPVLPTAGRDLRDCPWLSSTAEDMARTAALVKTAKDDYSLKNAPIIVIDQSDAKNKGLWDRNDAYCKGLELAHADTGLKIVHVSMADVNRLAGPGLKKMFDTTGQDFAGYGGARNMAYLIAPVIRQCEIDGVDWKTMTAEQALPLIQKHALEKSTTKLFMGDDTDQISEGTMMAKAVLAREHAADYALVSTLRAGRDTMGVSEAQTNSPGLLLGGGLDAFTGSLHLSNAWNPQTKAAGMGCTFGDSRFCLDLPLGAEEKQHEAMKSSIDKFSKSTHLSGDRQKDLGDYLAGHLAYTNSSGMVKSLVKEGDLPWNKTHKAHDATTGRPKFDSLDSVLKFASDPVQQKTARQNFFQNMANWRGTPPTSGALTLDVTPAEALAALGPSPAGGAALLAAAYRAAPGTIKTANGAVVDYYIKQHPELKPEDRAQLIKVRDTYEQAGAEIKLGREYMNRLMDELVPATDTTLAGSKLPLDKLKVALTASLDADPPNKAALAVAKVKTEMEAQGVDFNKNRLLRDMHLITESAGGSGFASLAQKLHTPAPRLEIGHAPEVVRRDDLALGSPGLEVPRSGVQIEPPKDPRLGAEVFSFGARPSSMEPPHLDVSEPIDLAGIGLGERLTEAEVEASKLKAKETLSTREALAKDGYKPGASSGGATGQRVSSTL